VNDIVGLEGPIYLKNKPQHHQLVAKRADLAKHLIKQQHKNHALLSEYEKITRRAETLARASLDYGHESARAQQKRNKTLAGAPLQTANMAEKLLKKGLQTNVRVFQNKKSSLRPHIK